MRIRHRLFRSALCVALTLVTAIAASGHEGEVHTTPPPPKSPLERLMSVFTGSNEGHSAPVDPIAISQTVEGGPGGKSQTRVITLYTPTRIRVGLLEPIRVQLTDVSAKATPLTGYSPEMTIHLPTGHEATAKLKEIAGSPGVYELAVPWSEAGEARVSLSVGEGVNALVTLEQPVYVKRPPVPLAPFLIVGVLAMGLVGALLNRKLKRPVIVWGLAALVGIGGALLVRTPLAMAATAIETQEAAYLEQAGAKGDQQWPADLPGGETSPAKGASKVEGEIEFPLTGDNSDLVDGVRPILGTLTIPADARAVLSAPQGGTLSSPTVFLPGTAVREGQVLATLRVLNTEVAPDAAEAPGAEAEAQAKVTSAETALAQAKRDADRGERLYAAEAISKRELEERRAAVMTAEAELTAAKEVLAAAQSRSSSLRAAGGAGAFRTVSLASPIDGVITEVGIAAGEYVDAGTMLYTIVTPGRLWIEARLFEDQLHGLTPGMVLPFTIALTPDESHSATLRSLGVAFDPETRTLPAHFEVIDGSGLYAGQQVTLVPLPNVVPPQAGEG